MAKHEQEYVVYLFPVLSNILYNNQLTQKTYFYIIILQMWYHHFMRFAILKISLGTVISRYTEVRYYQ